MAVKRWIAVVGAVVIALFGLSPVAFADGNFPITIENENIVAYPMDQSTLGMIQIMTIKNQASTKQTLKISLPKGYQNLRVVEGIDPKSMMKTDNGLVDKEGLAPGKQKRITLSYEVPMKTGQSQVVIKQNYLIKTLNVDVQEGVMTLRANDVLPKSNVFDMQGKKFRQFTRLDLHPDQAWTVALSLLDNASQSSSQQQNGIVGGKSKGEKEVNTKFTDDGKRIYSHQQLMDDSKTIFTLIVIVVALAMVIIGLRRDAIQNMKGPVKEKQGRNWLKAEKEELLQQMALLEKDYRKKLIGEQNYETTKQQIRERLVRLTIEIKGS